MSYIVICLTESDGEIHLECCSSLQSVKTFVEEQRLNEVDYAVIQGSTVKEFEDPLQIPNLRRPRYRTGPK